MNYGEMKTMFRDLINRTDITDSQVEHFLDLGLRRVERNLRTVMQRVSVTTTVGPTWPGYLAVPSDYLGLHYMKVNGVPISRGSEALAVPREGNYPPTEFSIQGGKIVFDFPVTQGTDIELCYYREFTEASTDASYTAFSVIIPDLVIYAGLVYACDVFVDVRKPDFDATFLMILREVQDLSDRDETSGRMVVQNPYAGIA